MGSSSISYHSMNCRAIYALGDCSCEAGENVCDDVAQFDSGATRSGETLYDPEGFLSPYVVEAYSKYMEKHRTQADGQLRNSDNWQKGMPKARYMRSLTRHFLDVWKVWRRDKADIRLLLDPLCAMLFNVQGMILEVLIATGEIKRPAIRSEE